MVEVHTPSGATQMGKNHLKHFLFDHKNESILKRYWFYTFAINLHHPRLLSKHVHLNIEVLHLNAKSGYGFVTYLSQTAV